MIEFEFKLNARDDVQYIHNIKILQYTLNNKYTYLVFTFSFYRNILINLINIKQNLNEYLQMYNNIFFYFTWKFKVSKIRFSSCCDFVKLIKHFVDFVISYFIS
jgi:hypothetical protein